MRMSSDALPRRATHFSDGTALVCRSCYTPWPRCAASGLLKTCNQLHYNPCGEGLHGCSPRQKKASMIVQHTLADLFAHYLAETSAGHAPSTRYALQKFFGRVVADLGPLALGELS